MAKMRIMFSGYAPVHFLCFRPVYERLREDPDIEIFLSGGFREKSDEAEATYRLDGFYEPYDVDLSHVISLEQAKQRDFDVLVCAHLSDALFPRSAKRTVQIFHGVSFKNLAVRPQALKFDYLCLPGRYHAERYASQGLYEAGASKYLITGFAKTDPIVAGDFDRAALLARLELEPDKPTILFAPTGEKKNALETMGKEVIRAIGARGSYNLMVKPHDHPKKDIDWFTKLAKLENERTRVIRDRDVIPYLRAADMLLTDASSVAVEYTLLDRPIGFLDVPELFERVSERAPALDLETYGRKIGTVIPGPEAVGDAVEAALANPRAQSDIRRKMAEHVFHRPGGATDRVAGVVRHAAGLSRELPAGVEVFVP